MSVGVEITLADLARSLDISIAEIVDRQLDMSLPGLNEDTVLSYSEQQRITRFFKSPSVKTTAAASATRKASAKKVKRKAIDGINDKTNRSNSGVSVDAQGSNILSDVEPAVQSSFDIRDDNKPTASSPADEGINSANKVGSQYIYQATDISHAEIPAFEDKLNRQQLVDALAANLISEKNAHHRTIGLLGEWGAGKTTILELLQKKLKKFNSTQPFIFGEFNAWSYEHTDNIQAGVAQEIIKALTHFTASQDRNHSHSSSTWRWLTFRAQLTWGYAHKAHPWQLLKILFLLFVAASPWLVTGIESLIDNAAGQSLDGWGKWLWVGGFGLYLSRELGKLVMNPHAKELLTYLRLPSYAEHLGKIPVMRENIRTLCDLRLTKENGLTPRLLFVVDDLDRCSSKAIIKVLEAVRLVLELDNVIVVIAIDQNIALAALSEHFDDFSKHHKLKNSHAIAREYLSKVINLPIVLTKPNNDDVKKFMDSFWDEMNKKADEEMGKALPSAQDKNVPAEVESLSVTPGDVVPSSVLKSIKALSKDHQQSFIACVNYFGLSNSRQLKRLNNSYDLMRSYLPEQDKTSVEFRQKSGALIVYPMLLTLILMEYLNSLHSLDLRSAYWTQLFSGSNEVSMDSSVSKIITPEFIGFYRSLLANESNTTLVANVEAFVLPAMS